MRTQKRTFWGIDITTRKALYAEIDALTEENREQAEEIGKLETDLTDKNITVQRLNAKAADFEEKYNAAVKYQQNTQAAYDELKADYEKAQVAYKEMKAEYDQFLARVKWGYTEGEDKNKVVEADAVPMECETSTNHEPFCETAKGLMRAEPLRPKQPEPQQPRSKDGRFRSKHKR